MVQEYRVQEEQKHQQSDEEACLEQERLEKECQDTTLKKVRLTKLDEEDRLRLDWLQRECQEQKKHQEAAQKAPEVTTPVAESPP